MSDTATQMNGTERAALLLMTLGENEAAEVLKFMGTNEVQKIGTAMASLKSVSRNDADQVLDIFIMDVEDQTALGVDTENYVRKLLGNAFGATKANAFIERIVSGDEAKGLEALKWMSSREVIDIIQDEHPQIIAIVLAYLDNAQAAALRYCYARRAPDRYSAECVGGNRKPDRQQVCEYQSRGNPQGWRR